LVHPGDFHPLRVHVNDKLALRAERLPRGLRKRVVRFPQNRLQQATLSPTVQVCSLNIRLISYALARTVGLDW
jgi:hypothetical protein